MAQSNHTKRGEYLRAYADAVANGEEAVAQAYAKIIEKHDAYAAHGNTGKFTERLVDAIALPAIRALGDKSDDGGWAAEVRHRDAGTGFKALTGVLDAPRQIIGGFNQGRRLATEGMEQLVDKAFSAIGMDDTKPSPVTGLTYKESRAAKLAEGKKFVDENSWMANLGEALGQGRDGIALGPMKGAGLLANTMTQAGIAGLQTPGDGRDRGLNAAFAGGGQMLGTHVGAALSHLAQPLQNITPAAQRLIKDGIYPTMGQAKGGAWKYFEDKLSSLPIAGDLLARGRRQVNNEFNSAALRRSGINVGDEIGSDAIGMIDNGFNTRFRNAEAPLSFNMNDPAFMQAMSDSLRNNVANRKAINMFTNSMNDFRTAHNLGPVQFHGTQGAGVRGVPPSPQSTTPGFTVSGDTGVGAYTGGGAGTNVGPLGGASSGAGGYAQAGAAPASGMDPALIDGRSVARLREYVRKQRASFSKSNDPLVSAAAPLFRDSLSAIDDGLQNQGLNSINDLIDWRKVQSDYAAYKPAQLASRSATSSNKNGGVFTPGEYASALRNNAYKNGNETQFGAGTLPSQAFSKDANEVLGQKYPDSGSAGRMGLSALIAGSGLYEPWTLAPLAAHALLTSSKPARKYTLGESFPNAQKTAVKILRGGGDIGGIGMGQALIELHRQRQSELTQE
jgi:hypothetical protein